MPKAELIHARVKNLSHGEFVIPPTKKPYGAVHVSRFHTFGFRPDFSPPLVEARLFKWLGWPRNMLAGVVNIFVYSVCLK